MRSLVNEIWKGGHAGIGLQKVSWKADRQCILMYKFSYEVMHKTLNTLRVKRFGEARRTLVIKG